MNQRTRMAGGRLMGGLGAVALLLAASASGAAGSRPGSAGGAGQRGIAQGPDVTVWSFADGINHYGPVGTTHAYAIGTESCNQGDEPLNWCDNPGGCGGGTTDSDHPVILGNLYRVKDGRFEQLGMSWLKHGFFALSGSAPGCGDGSCEPTDGDTLGVGCIDPYVADLNGDRPLGMRSEVNGATGVFPFPYTVVDDNDSADQRVQVEEADLDPDLNPGARYFGEAQYVAPDDAAAENGLNNASYQEVAVQANFGLNPFGTMFREQSAIYGWQLVEPEVEIVEADLPSTPIERFEAGRLVTQPLHGSTWHYEIAIHNLNSDRSAQALNIVFPAPATITNVGFRDVNRHSGEFDPDSGLPYSAADWSVQVEADSVRWTTEDFGANPAANALRWGTTYTFWFDASAPPDGVISRLELFKPGSPTFVDIPFSGSGAEIFADGFESGDTGEWDQTVN